MTSKEPKRAADSDPEIAGALAALKRARLRAEAVAAATGTALVFAINGELVRVRPEPARADSA